LKDPRQKSLCDFQVREFRKASLSDVFFLGKLVPGKVMADVDHLGREKCTDYAHSVCVGQQW
jgi:hypothetical protein